jgi:hypothetical protein
VIDRHAPGLADDAGTAWSATQIREVAARVERAIAAGLGADRSLGDVPAILRAEGEQLDRKWRSLRDEVRLRLVAAVLGGLVHEDPPNVVADRAIEIADAVIARLVEGR